MLLEPLQYHVGLENPLYCRALYPIRLKDATHGQHILQYLLRSGTIPSGSVQALDVVIHIPSTLVLAVSARIC